MASESAHLPMNFGGLSEEAFSSQPRARVLVWPVSYEGTVSYGAGTARGAEAIIDASRNMELYDEELDAETYRIGIHTLPIFPPAPSPAEMNQKLYEEARRLVSTGKFLVTLGGEHSITAPIVRAHAERYANFSVFQIDAHADLRATYDDTPYSHACVMRRIVEDLRIPAVQFGIRSMSAEEARVKDRLPTRIFWAKDVVGRPQSWNEAISLLTENVYLTIDIDGLDPSLVPHTGTPEPGGLGWYETLGLLRALAGRRRIVGMDLVEYAPAGEHHASAFLCAKLVYKTLGYIFADSLERVSI
ncbi:agmatinase [Pyrinomonas methylaliphatogenes]|jgi:agmatinase|nr:agmatinase [Pyrinomonas methylaliphatogenes]MBX5479814.1 agmatinase [Pyrinomonas methylaliphatogenes]